MRDLKIIPKSKIWFTLSSVLVGLSLIFFFTWGLKTGIDFTGGSILEVKFPVGQQPTVTEVETAVADLQLGSLTVQPTDSNGLIMRFQEVNEDTHQAIMEKLKAIAAGKSSQATATETPAPEPEQNNLQVETVSGNAQIAINDVVVAEQTNQANAVTEVEELRFESVGPSIGAELRRNAIYSIILVMLAIIAYVAWSFRKISRPVAAWKYGLAAIIAVIHDVIITVGVFTVLGKVLGVEVNTAFVAALLMVFGYSVNDTIVVFDRVRENLPKSDLDFAGTVNASINQTAVRSVNTSLTTMLVLTAIVLWGGDSIRYFALALLVGIFIGTYSSIFLASPLLLMFEKWKRN